MNSGARRPILLALYLLPIGALAVVLPVFLHEIVGHGVTALLVGGEFHGFTLRNDGMGSAYTTLSAEGSDLRRAFVLVGGAASTTVAGALLLLAAARLGRRPLLGGAALVLALGCILDGPAYMFWNSVRPVRPGDFGRILGLYPSWALRASFLSLGAAATVAGTWFATRGLLRVAGSWCAPEWPVTGGRRAVVLGFLALLTAASEFIFDWNLLAPGIGRMPQIAMALLHVAISAALWRDRTGPVTAEAFPISAAPWIAAWTAATALHLVIAFWWSRGVRWG